MKNNLLVGLEDRQIKLLRNRTVPQFGFRRYPLALFAYPELTLISSVSVYIQHLIDKTPKQLTLRYVLWNRQDVKLLEKGR